MVKDPFPSENICIGRARNEIPSAIGLESSEPINHGITPIGIGEGTIVCRGNRGQRCGEKIESLNWMTKTILSPCHHAVGVNHRGDGDGMRSYCGNGLRGRRCWRACRGNGMCWHGRDESGNRSLRS